MLCYVIAVNAIDLIEARRTEIARKVARLRVQLEAAEDELRNLDITAETLNRLSLNPEVETTVPRGQSYNHVFAVLCESEEDGKTPKEIHDALVASGITSISQDNVRTIVSRYRERLMSNDGRYWRPSSKEIEPPKGKPMDGSQPARNAQSEEATEW